MPGNFEFQAPELFLSQSEIVINEFCFRKDPTWCKETFTEAADKVGIRPLQAYKWGYHRKQKGDSQEGPVKSVKSSPKVKLKDICCFSKWLGRANLLVSLNLPLPHFPIDCFIFFSLKTFALFSKS